MEINVGATVVVRDTREARSRDEALVLVLVIADLLRNPCMVLEYFRHFSRLCIT